jgi:hypothetical protein
VLVYVERVLTVRESARGAAGHVLPARRRPEEAGMAPGANAAATVHQRERG